MTLQYILSGGQIYIDKKAFASEMLKAGGCMKKLLNTDSKAGKGQPKVTKTDDLVTIDYNNAADIILDEGFFDLFKQLKEKYKDRIKGRVVIRITALTSYHVVLNFNSGDNKITYES